MLAWMKANQKVLTLVLGSIMLIIGITMMFWDMRGDTVSDEERRAAENVARMEARMSGAQNAQVQPDDKALLSHKFKAHHEQQLRYAVILLILGGAGFMGYSLFRSYTDKKHP